MTIVDFATILGHCANDDNEPKLFRYKEECEDACIGSPTEIIGTAEPPTTDDCPTYATVGAGTSGGDNNQSESSSSSPSSSSSSSSSTTPTSRTTSECQRQREQRGRGSNGGGGGGRIVGGFVPECTSDGAFRPLQCEPDGRVCFCVTAGGIEVPGTRATLPEQRKPDCNREF